MLIQHLLNSVPGTLLSERYQRSTDTRSTSKFIVAPTLPPPCGVPTQPFSAANEWRQTSSHASRRDNEIWSRTYYSERSKCWESHVVISLFGILVLCQGGPYYPLTSDRQDISEWTNGHLTGNSCFLTHSARKCWSLSSSRWAHVRQQISTIAECRFVYAISFDWIQLQWHTMSEDLCGYTVALDIRAWEWIL